MMEDHEREELVNELSDVLTNYGHDECIRDKLRHYVLGFIENTDCVIDNLEKKHDEMFAEKDRGTIKEVIEVIRNLILYESDVESSAVKFYWGNGEN